jgi:NAD(P)-dependent dehydrogenase (short-subunit alcohol dehydrogenase family)
MDLKLEGRLALVSGSTAGIGHAIASALAIEGARVIVNGRAQGSVDAAVAQIRAAAGGEVLGFAGDLSTAAAAEDMVRRHPDIEILINNLGIFEPNLGEQGVDAGARIVDVRDLNRFLRGLGMRNAVVISGVAPGADGGAVRLQQTGKLGRQPLQLARFGNG